MISSQLLPVEAAQDIPLKYQNTPISLLAEYHNLNSSFDPYSNAEILVGMCIDNRKVLRIPDNFAFVVRAGGANMKYSEFKLSYAVAVGNISHIALIGHNHCRMVNLISRREEFINGLVEKAGWEKSMAEAHFNQSVPMFEIGNEIEFILSETSRLRERYPKVTIAPMFYLVDDSKLYFIKEN